MIEVLEMDDLEFRRAIYADPHCTDESVLLAAAQDPKKQEFWDELKKLDDNIMQASQIEVPAGLAQKLILKQTVEQHKIERKRTRVHLALAASIAFAFGISVTTLQEQKVIDLGEHALAHIYHEGDGYALNANGDLGLTQVNAKLASLGTQFTENVGRIYYANFCNFDGLRSFHMVMESGQGKVTVFVLPLDDHHTPTESFSDGKMHGETIETNKARFIIVGEEGKSIESFKSKLQRNVTFSA
jgi:hypothetical protein